MDEKVKGVYILFEKYDANSEDENINSYDCMGYALTEEDAMKWRNENLIYRTYKYCPNTTKTI